MGQLIPIRPLLFHLGPPSPGSLGAQETLAFTFGIKFKCECLGSFWIWSNKLSPIFPWCQQSRRPTSSLPRAPCSSLLSSFHRVPPLLALLCSYASPRRLEGPSFLVYYSC